MEARLVEVSPGPHYIVTMPAGRAGQGWSCQPGQVQSDRQDQCAATDPERLVERRTGDALRPPAAGLVVRNAICVVDREEGGADALARHGVRLRPLFTASGLLK